MIRVYFAAALAVALPAAPASAATLVGSYGFDNSLTSSTAGGPTLGLIDPTGTSGFGTDTVFGTERTVFNFRGATAGGSQSGLVFDAAGLLGANSYSVAMTFKFNERNGGWRRILGTNDRTDDDGFYVNTANNLTVFPQAGSNVNFVSGAYRNVVLTVDGNKVSAFIDGGASFSTLSDVMSLSKGSGKLTFFADNILEGGLGEWSSGSIAALRVYDGVLGATEIAKLNEIPFVNNAVPEPATWAMLISGFGLVGSMMRRRRRAPLALADGGARRRWGAAAGIPSCSPCEPCRTPESRPTASRRQGESRHEREQRQVFRTGSA